MPRAASNPPGLSRPNLFGKLREQRRPQLLRCLPEHQLEVADLPGTAGQDLGQSLPLGFSLRDRGVVLFGLDRLLAVPGGAVPDDFTGEQRRVAVELGKNAVGVDGLGVVGEPCCQGKRGRPAGGP